MHYFIVNPQASEGRGLKVWQQVMRRLARIGEAQNYEVFVTEKTGDARDISRKLTRFCKDAKTITVIGGDGTLNEVVDGSCLDQDNISFVFIPTGKSNDFARCVGKRLSLRKQLKHLFTSSEERRYDYGVMNCPNGNRRFVVSSGIGFDAAMFHDLIMERCEGKKHLLRSDRLTYLFTFIRELRRAKQTPGYIVLDGERRIEFNNILFISAHVHPYEGGYKLGPTANGEDGYLDLCVVSTRQKYRLIRIMLSALTGTHVRMTGVHCYRCQQAEIHTEAALPVHTDGENCGNTTDLTINCVPKKLRILV
jgi:YegS/Rv2252/BmrU family lipid kinase